MSAQMTNVQDIAVFMAAGNSTFTLVSKKTNVRFTYRVKAPFKDGKFDYQASVRFVQVMTGSDNESSYSYLGTLNSVGYRHGGLKAKVSADATSAKAFAYLVRCLEGGKMNDNLEFWHESKCGRCSKKLTVPASISTGLGEDCAERMGVFYAVAA